MRKTILIIYVLAFLFCFSCDSKKTKQNNEKIKPKVVHDELVQISLNKDMKFTWNITNSIIEEDSLFENIKKNYADNRTFLIKKIKDTAFSSVYLCDTIKKLRKGDLAFLLIHDIEDIPYYTTFKIQMDTFTYGCTHPNGLVDFINDRREFIIETLKAKKEYKIKE